MKLLVVAAATLILVLGAIVTGCDGGEQLSLEEYLQRLTEIQADASQRMDELDEEAGDLDAASGDDDRIVTFQRFFDGSVSSLQALVDDLEGLNPPAEAEAPHNALVEAESDGIELVQNLADGLEDVESGAELEDLVDERSGDFDEVAERVGEACFALQDLADENDIDVDLECEGEASTGVCESPLPPLGASDISELGFNAEDIGLTRVIDAASRGDLTAAESAFFGDVHNFTHNVDAPLRAVDDALAKELCEAVVNLEVELAFDRRADQVATEATRIRDLVRDSAEALGFGRPGP